MRVIARGTLLRFAQSKSVRAERSTVERALAAWYQEVCNATWTSPSDVKAQYRHASIVGPDRVVFNIRGNDYRLVASVDYRRGVVFIKWIGNHADYDWIDARTVQYGD